MGYIKTLKLSKKIVVIKNAESSMRNRYSFIEHVLVNFSKKNLREQKGFSGKTVSSTLFIEPPT